MPSISRRMICLNFFSFAFQVITVAMKLIRNAADKATQKVREPNNTLKKRNKKVERIIVPIKVPTIIYKA